jgi:hypothetical protein
VAPSSIQRLTSRKNTRALRVTVGFILRFEPVCQETVGKEMLSVIHVPSDGMHSRRTSIVSSIIRLTPFIRKKTARPSAQNHALPNGYIIHRPRCVGVELTMRSTADQSVDLPFRLSLSRTPDFPPALITKSWSLGENSQNNGCSDGGFFFQSSTTVVDDNG